jgi:hypothetical protein
MVYQVIIKGSEILATILKFIFNFSFSQQQFPTLWKQAAIVSVFKKEDKTVSVINYRPTTIINNVSKIFEIIVHTMFLIILVLNESLVSMVLVNPNPPRLIWLRFWIYFPL